MAHETIWTPETVLKGRTWHGGDYVWIDKWDDVVSIYENMDALLISITEHPKSYDVDGDIISIVDEQDGWLRINYALDDCSCTLNDEGDTIKDKCDCGTWYESFKYKYIEITHHMGDK